MIRSTRNEAQRGFWRRRSLLAAAALGVALPWLPAGAAASVPDAESFIRQIGDEVMVILTDQSKNDAQKLTELKTMLDSYTDIDLISRLVLGRYWKTASDEERDDYVKLFHELLMKTLAARLGDYNGQTFEIVGSQQVSKVDSTVATKIIRVAGKPPLKVDWRVRDKDGNFAIIDVVAEGVSLVVSQRNEVGSIVERDGMPGLIAAMRERRDALL
ncbi:MAG: ABC transporter substrate-binding protein [Geminicoccaceae bacterium]